MAGKFVLLLLLLILHQTQGQLCPPRDGFGFVDQPQDATVCVGSQVKMDCTFRGLPSAPLWLINSTVYTSSGLPPHHIYDGYTLIINNVLLDSNDTTYQCFFALFVDGSICQIKSTVGKLIVLTIDSCGQPLGPKNITHREGEHNVLIPCTVFSYIPPVWEINGSIYELLQLPEIFMPTYGGIVIKLVQRDLNGISFRCYASSGTGYTVKSSTTGYLTVTSRGGPLIINVEKTDLYLDHQNTFLNQNVTLSWKPILDHQCDDFEVISRATCGQTNQIQILKSWQANNQTVDIPLNDLSIHSENAEDSTLADILIEALNEGGSVCNKTDATIQIQNSATMVNLYSSLSRTPLITISNLINSTFHLVLPRSGFEEDCFCPVFFTEDSKYYDLKSCSCLNSTVFQNSNFNFCVTDDHKISFQVKNLSSNMNGSHLSIFHEFFCTRNFIPPYRIYAHLFEIAIVLPEPPDVIINEGSNGIRILPYDGNGNPPDYYHFIIYDITGETILSDNVSAAAETDIFIDDPILYQYSSECAPLLVRVSAVNKFGYVDTNVLINSDDVIGDACLCINETVRYSSVHNENHVLSISCNQSRYISDFKLKAAIDSKIIDIACHEKSLQLSSELECGTTYNVSIYWESPQESLDVYCLLENMDVVTPSCKPNGATRALVLSVILPIVFFFLIFLTVCTVIKFYVKRLHKNKMIASFHNVSSEQLDEDHSDTRSLDDDDSNLDSESDSV